MGAEGWGMRVRDEAVVPLKAHHHPECNAGISRS